MLHTNNSIIKHKAGLLNSLASKPFCQKRSWLGIYGHSRFCNTDFDDIVGLHESIRRLNGLYARAPMSSAPDEPYETGRQF